jgi:hypothetical protein
MFYARLTSTMSSSCKIYFFDAMHSMNADEEENSFKVEAMKDNRRKRREFYLIFFSSFRLHKKKNYFLE